MTSGLAFEKLRQNSVRNSKTWKNDCEQQLNAIKSGMEKRNLNVSFDPIFSSIFVYYSLFDYDLQWSSIVEHYDHSEDSAVVVF